MQNNGFFIAIDGLDGCGKTTQAKLLSDAVRDFVPEVCLTFEPGATAIGQSIRELILEPDSHVGTLCELFLMEADRAEHVAKIINPALERGAAVITDRFSLSTIVYQGMLGGVDLNAIAELDRIARQGIVPHLYIYLDVPVNVARQRLSDRSGKQTKYDQKPLSFFTQVRDGFLLLAKTCSFSCKLIDGTGSVEEVHSRIVDLLWSSMLL